MPGMPRTPRAPRATPKKTAAQLDREIVSYLGPLQAVTDAVHSIRDAPRRFGDRKVFVSAVWDLAGARIGMRLDEFKRWLIEQHRAGNLVLARADLVAAMDPELVRRSESLADGATFHFIVDRSVR